MALSPTTLETIKAARNKYSRNASNVVKIPEGRTKFRFVSNSEIFWRDKGVHWIKDPTTEKVIAAVGCHEVVHEKECPICSAQMAAGKVAVELGDNNLKEAVEKMKARKTVLIPAIVLDGKDVNLNSIQIVELTATTFDNVLSVAQTYADEDMDIFSLADGIDVIIERRGKGLDTEYTVTAAPKSTKLDAKALESTFPDIDAHIEKEFFRPDQERKALAYMGETFGIKTGPAISGPSNVRRLAPSEPSPTISNEIDDADYSTVIEEKSAPTKHASAPVTKAVSPPMSSNEADEIDAILSDLDID